jgi:hypothetical protein
MENLAGFRSIKKPVITEISTLLLATITVTDTLFLTKMQKRENPIELELPSTDWNHVYN